MKIFVGFSTKSSAVLPNFFCPLFRHCAIVIDNVFIQIAIDGIRCFHCGNKEIKKLEKAGWVFVEQNISKTISPTAFRMPNFLTCVGFVKRALAIHDSFIWTPDQLFRKISGEATRDKSLTYYFFGR